MSSSDRSLLTDYWHDEVSGPPLDGTYTLRIYDAPALNFTALEDVQIALHYRYWTQLPQGRH